MATLTIRNVDDEVVERLKQRAKANNRSLEAELRQIAAEAVREPSQLSVQELIDLAKSIAAMTPRDVPQTDSGILQAEGRGER